MRYVAAESLLFHEGHALREVETGAELRWIPDEQLSDRDHDHLERLRIGRRKGGDDSVILAFDVGGMPRWLRVPQEARPVADALADRASAARPTGGRAVRR